MTESDAREILKEHKIERGLDDPRTCAEIVTAVEQHDTPALPDSRLGQNITAERIALDSRYYPKLPLRERRPFF